MITYKVKDIKQFNDALAESDHKTKKADSQVKTLTWALKGIYCKNIVFSR